MNGLGDYSQLNQEDNLKLGLDNVVEQVEFPQDLIALIDADSLPYVISYEHRETPPEEEVMVILSVDSVITEILEACKTKKYIGFLAGDFKTTRYHTASIAPYKGKRAPLPEWYTRWAPVVKKRLVEEHNFHHTYGIESDDALAIIATEIGTDKVIICSNDKDMRQLPGYHFDLGKRKNIIVTPEEAAYNFWEQMIKGDGTDNIKGIPKHGDAAVLKILGKKDEPSIPIEQFQSTVFMAYVSALGVMASHYFAENYSLLRLRRNWPFNYPEECTAQFIVDGTYVPTVKS